MTAEGKNSTLKMRFLLPTGPDTKSTHYQSGIQLSNVAKLNLLRQSISGDGSQKKKWGGGGEKKKKVIGKGGVINLLILCSNLNVKVYKMMRESVERRKSFECFLFLFLILVGWFLFFPEGMYVFFFSYSIDDVIFFCLI